MTLNTLIRNFQNTREPQNQYIENHKRTRKANMQSKHAKQTCKQQS